MRKTGNSVQPIDTVVSALAGDELQPGLTIATFAVRAATFRSAAVTEIFIEDLRKARLPEDWAYRRIEGGAP